MSTTRPSTQKPPERPDLTPRLREVLDAIRRLVRTRGYAPTFREIAEFTGLASIGTVAFHLRKLERGGYLRRNPGSPRSIVLVDDDADPEPVRPELERLSREVDRAEQDLARRPSRQGQRDALAAVYPAIDEHIITPEAAAHVLFHNDAGGYRAEVFTCALIALIARADVANRALLAGAYPAYVTAVNVIEGSADGIAVLTGIAGTVARA